MNYAYWLCNIPGIGNRTIHRLVAQAGSAGELYFLGEKELWQLGGVGEREVRAIAESRKRDVEADYARLCGAGITFLSLEDDAYPAKLRNIPDAPYGLYLKGRLPEEGKKTVAIVGARLCSEYGRRMAEQLGKELALRGVCVVSGMARGIDGAGHRGALLGGGRTAAVLGCGTDVCYPPSNQGLYREILEKGGLLSEYPPGTPPLAGHFPARNRIISGLSDAVVVVEARRRSGSLITADHALEQGRDIYAVPGRLGDPLSAGCNALIWQGARIIHDIGEFLDELHLSGDGVPYQETLANFALEKEERLVYSCVDLRPKGMEELLAETRLPMPELSVALARLAAKGFIAETFKNCYVRLI